jgi:uncharacterized OB-fold protein
MKLRPDFPLPDLDWEPTREFWAAAARGVLAIPRCAACDRWVWYPTTCRACGGERLAWTATSGRGRLFSWTVVRRAFLPRFAAMVPYVTGLVALAEEPAVRIVTLIVDCAPEALRIDQPVRAVFRPLTFAGIERQVIAPMFAPDVGSD